MNTADRAPFDPQPTLDGALVRLRPLRADDWPALYAVASDPRIWEQHPASDRWQAPVFRQFFDDAIASGSAFAVIDRATDAVIGSSRYHGYDPQARVVEIGWTFLARTHWGGRFNGEMKRLMLAHAFRWVDRVLFMVGPDNRRSQEAVRRIGAVETGREHDAPRGDRVVFALDRETFVAGQGTATPAT